MLVVFFWFLICLIVYTMVGYPLLLELLNKIVPHRVVALNHEYRPFVSIIIPAYNEEKVIEKKIENLLNLEYPSDLFEIIVASDSSTDQTNELVEKLSKKDSRVRLHLVKQRMGKTNAQNEAVEFSKGEVLFFTDANSILEKNSLKELVSFLGDESIGYVAGKLVYTNVQQSITSNAESSYWNIDLRMREIESNLSSITAGNGSLYAVRSKDYIYIKPINSHDSVFPPKYVLKGQRAVYNEQAIAFEKAGENDSDELQRKIRMSRNRIRINFLDMGKYNIFKNGWFSFFYFSHRTLRNNLYLQHILLLITNFFLLSYSNLYRILFICQLIFYLVGYTGRNSKNKFLKIPSYYCLTIFAQAIGAYREITGKSKPFWEKAESTR